MCVDFWDAIEGTLALLPQYYDSWELDQVRRHLPPSGTFVDLGANIGAYALWAAHCVGPQGKVLAVEAERAIVVATVYFVRACLAA